ncbi:hypothetical protein D3C81_1921700 [compost metagenome]
MVAANAVDAAEHGVMRTPTVPEELDHRYDHSQADTRHRAEYCHADETDNRQPEFPPLDSVDALQVLEFK